MSNKGIKNKLITIVAQQFYGNRTCTEISREHVNYFIRGILGEYDAREIRNVNLQYVTIPHSDGLLVVYDQTQEDEYVNYKFPRLYADYGADYKSRCGKELEMQVSCEIPEIGFKIHTRCFACRMNSHGGLISIKPSDYSIIQCYFTE